MWRRLDKTRHKTVNLTGTGVEGIGGLTMVMLGVMMSTVVPAIWWFVFGGVVCGVVLGVVMVKTQRFARLNTEARRHGVFRLG